MNALRRLSRPAMVDLAAALETGRVVDSYTTPSLRHHIPKKLVGPVQGELRALRKQGLQPIHIAYMLRLVADERAASQAIADRVELVWSGPEVLGGSRDTAVVVQELFAEARASVLIASYALDAGKKAEAMFGSLAERMDAESALDVRLFVNVHRKHKDQTAEAVLLREFADWFRDDVWPGDRLPEVFHDPRSLATDGTTRACLHAKCIVIDERRALLTSANFTEAAHERNIEAGTVISDTILARALKAQFDTLVDHGELRRVPGLSVQGTSPSKSLVSGEAAIEGSRVFGVPADPKGS